MPIKKLFNVYLKAETAYNDTTYSTISATDWIPVYADTVDIQVEAEKFVHSANTATPIVESLPYEVARYVKFSWEMPIRVLKETVVKSSVADILRGGLFTGVMSTLSVGDSSGSFAIVAQSGAYEVKVSGCRVTSIEFLGKPGEPMRMRVEGSGIFRSESFSTTPFSPTPTFASIILVRATSTSGEWASYFKEFNVKIEADSHLKKDLTTSYVVNEIIPTTIKIAGKISGLSDSIAAKYVGDTLSSTGLTFTGNGNSNTLQFTFASPRVSERKIGDTDGILYTDLEFVAAGLTLQFNSN